MAAPEAEALRSEVARLHRRIEELERRSSRDLASLLGSILQALPAIVLGFDAELTIRFVSHLVAGLQEEKVVGRPALDFIPEEDHPRARATIEAALRTGEVGSYETTGPGPHGTQRRYRVFVSPTPLADGTVGGCFIALDISDIVSRERALAETEQKLRIALASTRLGLWSWDLARGEVLWDEGMRQLMGRDEPLDLTRYVEVVAHPDDRDAIRRSSERAAATGTFEPAVHRILRPDGEVRWILTLGELERDETGRPVRFMGGSLDVTEQRALEEQLRRAQKMEAVGRLTAGVAHNFNNMLMVAMPSLDLLKKVVPDSHAAVLGHARDALSRAADMVRKLMTFAGQRRRADAGLSDPAELARRLTSMCERTFERHVTLRCEVADEALRVRVEESDLEQVLMNLLLNARDAVVEGGREAPRIEVSVSRRRDPRFAAGGGVVALSVRDNGAGMSEEVKGHAFEPFFTSKPVGRGTGLGLATCYAIVRDVGGLIDIDSTEGEGTTVSVLLPASDDAPEPGVVPGAAAVTKTDASVLVIDDEPAIVRTVIASLEELGYRAIGAADGAAAQARLERQPVDVILLDRSLPGTPGTALLSSLRARAPRARIAYFTGQEVTPEERAAVDGVIEKPVSGTDLARAVAALSRKP